MNLTLETNPAFTKQTSSLDEKFNKLIHGDEYGFYHVNRRKELISSCEEVYQKYSHYNSFVQVGIGGSSLGPEMLVKALQKNDCHFSFMNNIDPDHIRCEFQKLDLEKTLFYVVSKSGGTAETMASFAIITNLLLEKGVSEESFKEKFIFATDSKKSDLLDLGRELGITCLEVPSNVGGRFCALTPVGYLPALFAGLDIEALAKGAELAKPFIESQDFSNLAHFILDQKEKGRNQTVMMPYSSRLKEFSSWFTQLWAESLGKKLNNSGDTVNTGLTPIASYGATDQHSQVQLFMEGPHDKVVFFVEVEKFDHDYSLKTNFKTPALQNLKAYNLSQLMKAELMGTQKALSEQERPYISCKLKALNEESLGGLILICESLTAYVGLGMDINPFDQPGVEAGKKYAFEWLGSLS